MNKEFERFAALDRGISSTTLGRYSAAVDNYINPSIIEERKLNIASMDVFSRLLMDRIVFLGVPIYDDVANIIQAQLLFLASTDDKADISMYLNTPGGQVSSGLAIYDTMQLINPDVATLGERYAFSGGNIENIARKSAVEYVLSGKRPELETLIKFCDEENLSKQKNSGKRIGFTS